MSAWCQFHSKCSYSPEAVILKTLKLGCVEECCLTRMEEWNDIKDICKQWAGVLQRGAPVSSWQSSQMLSQWIICSIWYQLWYLMFKQKSHDKRLKICYKGDMRSKCITGRWEEVCEREAPVSSWPPLLSTSANAAFGAKPESKKM